MKTTSRGVRRFRRFNHDTMAIIRELAKKNGVPLNKRGRVHALRTDITANHLRSCAKYLSEKINRHIEFGKYDGHGNVLPI